MKSLPEYPRTTTRMSVAHERPEHEMVVALLHAARVQPPQRQYGRREAAAKHSAHYLPINVPLRSWTPRADDFRNGRKPQIRTTAVLGAMPKSRIMMGVINDPPPTPESNQEADAITLPPY